MNSGERAAPVAVDPQRLASLRTELATALMPAGQDRIADAARVDLLTAAEELKNTLCAVQAQLAVDLHASVCAQDAAAGKPTARHGEGAVAQIALARAESPHRGRQLLGLAYDLCSDLPHTFTALRAGKLSEYRASVIDRESGCLEREERQVLDRELFAGLDAAGVPLALSWGTRQLAAQTARIGYRLDPAAAARRAARAESERRVGLRPAPDTMTYLTALLPVAQGVAAHAALTRGADRARVAGDPRGKGQLMADLLVAHLTGTGTAEADGAVADGTRDPDVPGRPAVPLTVNLIMSEGSLLGSGHEPALLLGAGAGAVPIPAQSARDLVANTLDADTSAWIRRLYADPAGDLVAMTSTQRFVRGNLAHFLRIRDQGLCRTPHCDGPITESDHIEPVSDGGVTSAINGQGLCSACNHDKQAAGWWQRPSHSPGERHHVITRTPTGHTYTSTSPDPPRPRHPEGNLSDEPAVCSR